MESFLFATVPGNPTPLSLNDVVDVWGHPNNSQFPKIKKIAVSEIGLDLLHWFPNVCHMSNCRTRGMRVVTFPQMMIDNFSDRYWAKLSAANLQSLDVHTMWTTTDLSRMYDPYCDN